LPAFYYHYGSVYSLATFENATGASLLLSGGEDKWLCLWDARSRILLTRAKMLAPVRCSDFHHESGDYVAVGMGGGIIAVYALAVTRTNSAVAFDR